MYRFFVSLLVVCNSIAGSPVLAAPAGLDTCAECHGADGMGHGNPMIPVIAGIPAEHIEEDVILWSCWIYLPKSQYMPEEISILVAGENVQKSRPARPQRFERAERTSST